MFALYKVSYRRNKINCIKLFRLFSFVFQKNKFEIFLNINKIGWFSTRYEWPKKIIFFFTRENLEWKFIIVSQKIKIIFMCREILQKKLYNSKIIYCQDYYSEKSFPYALVSKIFTKHCWGLKNNEIYPDSRHFATLYII